MTDTTKEFTRVNHQWIKADSGATYLCPVEELQKLDNPSEEDLAVW